VILGGYARDLTPREIRGAVARLALRPDAWSPLVRHDPEERIYEEIYRDEHLSAWLICWMPGQGTGLHDHAGSAGAVTVVSGAVLEQRLGPLGDLLGNVYSRGEVFDVTSGVVHRVRHHGVAPATTLHAYSPPLDAMGSYVERDGGGLERIA
jgi:quercetin dioxygenase-like cupin family protein